MFFIIVNDIPVDYPKCERVLVVFFIDAIDKGRKIIRIIGIRLTIMTIRCHYKTELYFPFSYFIHPSFISANNFAICKHNKNGGSNFYKVASVHSCIFYGEDYGSLYVYIQKRFRKTTVVFETKQSRQDYGGLNAEIHEDSEKTTVVFIIIHIHS